MRRCSCARSLATIHLPRRAGRQTPEPNPERTRPIRTRPEASGRRRPPGRPRTVWIAVSLLLLVALPVALGESNVAYGQDERALVLSVASIEMPEDGVTTYTVELATRPTGTVIVTFSGVSGDDPSPDPKFLIFTASNWNMAQTITLTAPHDDNGVNDEVTLTHNATGGGYDAVSKDLPITVIDIDERIWCSRRRRWRCSRTARRPTRSSSPSSRRAR